jgi:hypothetical protein
MDLRVQNDDEVTQTPAVTVGFDTNYEYVAEGNGGSRTVPLTVSLSSPSTDPVTVHYTVGQPSFGSATAGEDFSAETVQPRSPRQTEATISVTVTGDTVLEEHESFYITLTGADGAQIVVNNSEANRSNFKLVTLNDDDTAQPAARSTVGELV